MPIQDQLTEDLKTAMKAQDVVTKDTVRLIRAAIKNAEIEKGAVLDEEGSLGVLSRMAKQYRDSIKTYRDAGREDLVSKEEAELEVVVRYLPEQLGEQQIRELVQTIMGELEASGPQDRGKVMGRLMPQLKGRADGSVVSGIVAELLG